jgi:CrcB protein
LGRPADVSSGREFATRRGLAPVPADLIERRRMKLILLAAAGGALGSSARYLVGLGAGRLLGTGFPWGTFTVNVAGCFVMGVLVGLAAHRMTLGDEARVFLMTGILGGFTTFSAFSADALLLVERRDFGLAVLYVTGSVALSLAAVFAGLYLIRSWQT